MLASNNFHAKTDSSQEKHALPNHHPVAEYDLDEISYVQEEISRMGAAVLLHYRSKSVGMIR